MSETTALPGEDRQEEADEASPLRIALGFFIVPLLIVIGGVAVFTLFGLVAHEDKSVDDYLAEVTGGGINEPWQGALRLANELQQDPSLQGSDSTAVRLADALEHPNAEDPDVRKFLVLALGRVGHPDSTDVLAEHLEDGDADVRLHALWGIGNIGPPAAAEVAPEVAAALDDEDAGVRAYAAYVLGGLENSRVSDTLRVALNDPAAPVRWNAAVALARLGDDAGLDQLETMLDRDKITTMSQTADLPLNDQQQQATLIAAIQGVSRLGAVQLAGELQQIRDNDPDLRVRQAAREALASMQATPR